MIRRRWCAVLLGAVLLAACGGGQVPAASPSSSRVPTTAPAVVPALPAVGHVWLVVLENRSYAESFSPRTQAPYLLALARRGALLPQYFAVAHASLPNYLALVSGQGPNPETRADCRAFSDFRPTATPDREGQLPGSGCRYPRTVRTVVDLLEQKGLGWKGYLGDLGASTTRQVGPCGLPRLDARGRDLSQRAAPTDQYAARHNPFVYFRGVTDVPGRCARHLSGMTALVRDVRSVATTPALSLLVPNLCDDGHDTGCAGPDVAGDRTGGLTAVQHWLTRYVPVVLASPAYKEDGLLLVTWDEGKRVDRASCCGLRSLDPGARGGGGRVGLIAVSPFIRPGTVSTGAYNHYGLLRTLADLFGVTRLGYAGQTTGVETFGRDVFTG